MADEDSTRKRIRLIVEKDKESSNDDQPLLEARLDKLKSFKKSIKEVLDWARLVVVCFAAGAIMIGVVYNFFANTEKDIPDVVFQKLYKFIGSSGGSTSYLFSNRKQYRKMESASSGERNKQLDDIYYNPQDPGSYGGVKRLLKRVREVGIAEINQAKIKDYLRDQQAYTLHKPSRKHFF